MRTRFKKYFYGLLLAELILSYLPTQVLAADQYDYSTSGVSKQIATYLCAPSDVNQTQTNLTTGTTWRLVDGGYQYYAAAGNNNANDLYKCINQLYKFAIILSAVIGVFFIVIAGYIYMSAEGNQESIDKAKNILTTTITSIVILMAGYLLLKGINPDIIQFKSVQPPSVKINTAGWSNFTPLLDKNGTFIGVQNGSESYKTLGKNNVDLVSQAGCTFQNNDFKIQLSGIQPDLFNALVDICKAGSTVGKIQISSVTGGTHATNSYHYKFCAVDLADGTSTFRNNAAGKAAESKAKSFGSLITINPGTDADKIDHLHLDARSKCTQ